MFGFHNRCKDSTKVIGKFLDCLFMIIHVGLFNKDLHIVILLYAKVFPIFEFVLIDGMKMYGGMYRMESQIITIDQCPETTL